MTIYEKILDIMQCVQRLEKDDHVKFGQTSYKALSEEKVTTIMRQQLISHKLTVYPVQQQSIRNGQVTHVDVVYRMVNVENPDEYIDIASCGDGADSQDKGSGKAMTYAYKYMWLRTFALPTGEDPDKISSAELDANQSKTEAAAAKMAARAECQKAVRAACQARGLDTNSAWASIAEAIGKASKEFTREDWQRGQAIAEGWLTDA